MYRTVRQAVIILLPRRKPPDLFADIFSAQMTAAAGDLLIRHGFFFGVKFPGNKFFIPRIKDFDLFFLSFRILIAVNGIKRVHDLASELHQNLCRIPGIRQCPVKFLLFFYLQYIHGIFQRPSAVSVLPVDTE